MSQKASERLFKVGGNSLLLSATILGLERWALDQIEDKTPDDVYYLIEKNEPAVLSRQVIQWAKPLFARFRATFDNYTSDYLLELLRTKRPELWGVVSTHPKGTEWLEMRLQEVRNQLS